MKAGRLGKSSDEEADADENISKVNKASASCQYCRAVTCERKRSMERAARRVRKICKGYRWCETAAASTDMGMLV